MQSRRASRPDRERLGLGGTLRPLPGPRGARGVKSLRCPECCPEPRAHDVRYGRGSAPGQQGLQPRPQGRAIQDQTLDRPHYEEGHARNDRARDEPRPHVEAGEDEGDERSESNDEEGGEGGESRSQRTWSLHLQAQLLREHGVHPEPAVGGYRLDDSLQGLAGETFGGEDLAYFLALAFGDLLDLALLAVSCLLDLLALALGPLVVAHRHAEAVGKEVGEAEHDHHEPGETGSHGSRHDCEGGNATVYAAQHGIPEVALAAPLLEAGADLLRAVLGLQPFARLHLEDHLSPPHPCLRGWRLPGALRRDHRAQTRILGTSCGFRE